MTTTFVLMTAMPPTRGHLNLVRFAASLGQHTVVLLCTQPSEPMRYERYFSMFEAIKHDRLYDVELRNYHKELPQDPDTEGFWTIWQSILREHGAQPNDTFVSSEPYGQKLAELLGGVFIPYDPGRELLYTKATDVREHTLANFDMMIPEFQGRMRTKVTVFGAESTGKTTLSQDMAEFLPGHWLYEWARPYLETVGPEITVASMTAIWRGQAAAQRHMEFFTGKPFLVQDTDLYSTIGYWEQPHWREALGPVPQGLLKDAEELKSDLYVITKSNIDFERDPLRYGGDHRESPDEYWVDVAERYGLKYRLIDPSKHNERLQVALGASRQAARKHTMLLEYDRNGF